LFKLTPSPPPPSRAAHSKQREEAGERSGGGPSAASIKGSVPKTQARQRSQTNFRNSSDVSLR